IKVDANGSLSVPNIIKGIDYAIEQGADVINLSLGGTYIDEREQHAIERALAQNITITAAAGNEAESHNRPNYPASYDGVLSIGAIDEQQQRAFFSTYNNQLSFVAPGAKLPLIQNDTINEINGTSFASPFVAGLIAALQQYSDAAPDMLQQALKTTATDLAAPGYDVETGYGLIHASNALQWLRGDELPLRTMTNPFVTVTFSSDVSPNTTLTLYKDGQIVATTTTVTNDTATVTPEQIVHDETYVLKLDRSVTSAEGVALSEPMYVPIQFVQ
ncbi:MAG: S8 family serine peptidase, partial [Caryophanon sp.]|nr:S8 family serine peptidase [Caryophanon sp.]